MQLWNSTFPSVSEWVCYAEMSQKTFAFFYKNIIRNAKLRKLKIQIFLFFLLFFFFFLKWSPKNFFLFYLIRYYEALPLEIFWFSTLEFFFKIFFFKCPKWTRSQLCDVSYVLVLFSSFSFTCICMILVCLVYLIICVFLVIVY